MNTTRELVTPAQAKLWLAENNTRNRPLSEKTAKLYAKDMAAGDWHDTHQGIAFYEDGVLADGQTRLLALTIADRPIHLLVTRGLPLSASIGVDAHRMRSVSDQIAIAGVGNWIDKSAVSIAKLLLEIGHGPSRVSTTRIVEVCNEHRQAIEFAASNFRTHVRLVTSAPTKTAVVLAFYHVWPPKLQEFCKALTTGLIDGEGQSAVIRLRERLLSSEGAFTRSYAGRHSQMMLTERAIKAFCKGEPLGKLLAPKEHIFTLPRSSGE